MPFFSNGREVRLRGSLYINLGDRMSEELEPIKNTWLEQFSEDRPDLFFPAAWSEEKKSKAVDTLRSESVRSRIFTSIPMKCKGPDCQLASVCPLQQEGMAPVGERCPIEMSMLKQLTAELVNEFRVDEKSINELAQIRDLVNQEIQHIRATNILAQEDFMQDVFAGLNERTGEVIYKKELHQAINFEDKILKRKKELRNQFLATREAKSKAGMGQIDTSKVVSEMMHDIEQIRIDRERAVREKLGISEVDEYIRDSEIVDAEVVEHDEDS